MTNRLGIYVIYCFYVFDTIAISVSSDNYINTKALGTGMLYEKYQEIKSDTINETDKKQNLRAVSWVWNLTDRSASFALGSLKKIHDYNRCVVGFSTILVLHFYLYSSIPLSHSRL